MSKKKKKIIPLSREELDAAAKRLNDQIMGQMNGIFEDRRANWGISKFWLAERMERPQSMVERLMTGKSIQTFRSLGATSCALEVELKIELLPK